MGTKLNKVARNFIDDERKARAAVTEERKKERKRKWRETFVHYLSDKYIALEANGNSAAALEFWRYWSERLKPAERNMFDRACGKRSGDKK